MEQANDSCIREFMMVSNHDRAKIQEEIHGVGCLAPEESPEYLKASLQELQLEIDNTISPDKKLAYLLSQKKSFWDGDNTTYVNTRKFRLRFLRSQLFDAAKAAASLCKYLELVLHYFGAYALYRPIKITDFARNEVKYLQKGRFQFQFSRDRGGIAGRRVCWCFQDQEWESIPFQLREKIILYWTWAIGNDVNVQREGLVFVIWFCKDFHSSSPYTTPTIHLDTMTLTVRACAIHCCMPETPFHRVSMQIKKLRSAQIVVHSGADVMLRYKLHSYGIQDSCIPITSTGTIKTVFAKQSIKTWVLIEKGRTIIDSPYLSDILFRKGICYTSHPGNEGLRAKIVSKAMAETNLRPYNRTSLKTFVNEIIEDTKENGVAIKSDGKERPCRLLIYNDEGYWEELKEDEIFSKIKYVVQRIRAAIYKNYRMHVALSVSPEVTRETENTLSASLISFSSSGPEGVSTEASESDESSFSAMSVNAPTSPCALLQENENTEFEPNPIPARLCDETFPACDDEIYKEICESEMFGLPFSIQFALTPTPSPNEGM